MSQDINKIKDKISDNPPANDDIRDRPTTSKTTLAKETWLGNDPPNKCKLEQTDNGCNQNRNNSNSEDDENNHKVSSDDTSSENNNVFNCEKGESSLNYERDAVRKSTETNGLSNPQHTKASYSAEEARLFNGIKEFDKLVNNDISQANQNHTENLKTIGQSLKTLEVENGQSRTRKVNISTHNTIQGDCTNLSGTSTEIKTDGKSLNLDIESHKTTPGKDHNALKGSRNVPVSNHAHPNTAAIPTIILPNPMMIQSGLQRTLDFASFKPICEDVDPDINCINNKPTTKMLSPCDKIKQSTCKTDKHTDNVHGNGLSKTLTTRSLTSPQIKDDSASAEKAGDTPKSSKLSATGSNNIPSSKPIEKTVYIKTPDKSQSTPNRKLVFRNVQVLSPHNMAKLVPRTLPFRSINSENMKAMKQEQCLNTVCAEVMERWSEYINMTPAQLHRYECLNARSHLYTEEAVAMVEERDRYVWQLIDEMPPSCLKI